MWDGGGEKRMRNSTTKERGKEMTDGHNDVVMKKRGKGGTGGRAGYVVK